MSKQPLLPGTTLTLCHAISVLPLTTLKDGSRGVSSKLQKAFLHYLAGYQSRECWKSEKEIALDPLMQQKFPGVTHRSIGPAIRVLERVGIIHFKPNPLVRSGRTIVFDKDAIRSRLNEFFDQEDFTANDVNQNEIQSGPAVLPNQDQRSYQVGPAVLPVKDQRSYQPGPAVLPIRKETNEIETTTTETEWKPVVVSLDEIGVSQIGQAIAKAKKRGDSPEDVLRIIERTKADPMHQGKDLRGIVKNQICNPSKPEPIRRSKRPDRAKIWTRAFREVVTGKRPCTVIEQEKIELLTEQRYQALLLQWNKTYSPQVSGAGK